MGKPIASGVVHIDLNDSSTSNVTLGTYSLNSTHEYRRQLRIVDDNVELLSHEHSVSNSMSSSLRSYRRRLDEFR